MILYKYRQNSSYTDQILVDGKVWLAKSSSLNDPCECTLHSLAPEWVAEQLTTLKVAQMAGFLIGLPGVPPSPAAAEFRIELDKIGSFEEKYQTFRRMFEVRFPSRLSNPDLIFDNLEDQLKNVGVFSLSESAEHPLMWAHYAGNHEGVCLGFEVADGMASSDRVRFIRVTYTDQVPRMSDGFLQEIAFAIDETGKLVGTSRIPLTDSTLRSAIGTKSTSWEYESEWRYVESSSGPYDFPGPLVDIVFGLRCTPENRQHYKDLAAAHIKNDVRLYEMKRVQDSLAFERVFLGVCHSNFASGKALAPLTVPFRDETSVAENHPEIQYQIERGQFNQVLPAIELALVLEPNSSKLWRMKGVALGKSQRHREALDCFERATELNPLFFSAWYHRGVACTALERYHEAMTAYKEAHRLDPADASTTFNIGCILAHLGRLEEAKKTLITAETAGHPRARDVLDDVEKAIRGEA
jgi:Flp pilus assembly protein TadD